MEHLYWKLKYLTRNEQFPSKNIKFRPKTQLSKLLKIFTRVCPLHVHNHLYCCSPPPPVIVSKWYLGSKQEIDWNWLGMWHLTIICSMLCLQILIWKNKILITVLCWREIAYFNMNATDLQQWKGPVLKIWSLEPELDMILEANWLLDLIYSRFG